MLAAMMADVQPAAADAVQPGWLAVTMNGIAHGEILVLRRGRGVYVPAEALRRWGVKLEGVPTTELNHQAYVALGAHGLTFVVDEAMQTLALDVAVIRLRSNTVSLRERPPGRITPSGWGAFVNYDVLADYTKGSTGLSGLIEAGVFSPQGSGTATFVARSHGRDSGVMRLETSWAVDAPDRLRSLRFGDGVSRSGIGGSPFRFGGVQFGRSFDVQPGFVTMPLPSLGGDAALPAVADVYVNNVLVGHKALRPGAFAITDVPVVSGTGTVSLKVRDMLGRETSVSQSYYAAPELLRRRLDDYSVEFGLLRRHFGTRSFDYGALFAAATYRRGLSNTLTGETHAELTADVQQVGAAASAVLPGIALTRLGMAFSQSDAGLGMMLTAGIERSAPRLSFGVIGEVRSGSFVANGEPQLRPRRSVIAHGGLPLSFGSIGASYALRSYRSLPDLRVASFNASIRLARSASLALFTSTSWGAIRDIGAQLRLVMPLGRRTTATAGLRTRRGGVSAVGSLQQNLPVGRGVGYNVSAELGKSHRLDGRVAFQTDFGTYGVEGSWNEWSSAARLSASGSIGVIGDTVFAARRLTQSFAAVRVGDFPGVSVYADNQLVGRTGRDGIIIVPDLRTFDDNAIRIDSRDLPMAAQLTIDSQSVRPPRRAGVLVDFSVASGRDAIVTVRLADGSALPKGTRVHLAGSAAETVAGADGTVYLSELAGTSVVLAEIHGGTCSFTVVLPEGRQPQPQLGPFTCVMAARP